MKKLFLLLLFIFTLCASENLKIDNLHNKNLKEQMDKEKKYAEEQKFYMGKDYDLKGFQVDEKSLKNIPNQPDYNEDFEMDNVYD